MREVLTSLTRILPAVLFLLAWAHVGSGQAQARPQLRRSLRSAVSTSGSLSSDQVRGRAPSRTTIDGFDVSYLLDDEPGCPLPLDGLAAYQVVTAAKGAVHGDTPGAAIDVVTTSGSNRLEAMAGIGAGLHDEGQAAARATVTGPLVRDRAWYAFAGEALAGPLRAAELPASLLHGAALGKVTWQVTQRHKVTLLTVGGREDGRDATFAGVALESLLTDNVFADLRVASRSEERSDPDGAAHITAPQVGGRLQVFPSYRTTGDHEIELAGWTESASGSITEAASDAMTPPARLEGRRLRLSLQDKWRPLRRLTLTPGLAYVDGTFEIRSDALGSASHRARGLTPHAALALDLTGDGRTVLRASFGGYINPASFAQLRAAAHADPTRDHTGSPFTWEQTAGLAREVVSGIAASADLIRRVHADLPGDDRPRAYQAMRLAVYRPEGWLKLHLAYTLQNIAGAPHAFAAHAHVSPLRRLGLGASLLHDDVWQLPGRSVDPTPHARWLGGLRADLGVDLGIPFQLTAEVLAHAHDTITWLGVSVRY